MRHSIRLTIGIASILLVTLPATAGAAPRGVSIIDFAYQPATIAVALGTTVVWTNVGDIPHVTISNTQNPSNPDGTTGVGWWDSDYIAPMGGTFAWAFSAAGTYPYHGEVPDMNGSVAVPLRIRAIDPGVTYRVTWATDLPTEPDLLFLIQRKDPGQGEVFDDWKTSNSKLAAKFQPDGPGTYEFRARLVRVAGGLIVGSSMYSPVVSITVP